MCCFLTILGCSSKQPSVADAFKGQTAEQIYTEGEKALAKHKWEQAIRHFEGLDTLYPFSEYSEQAQINSIYAFYKNNDFASCAGASQRYIHLYPRSKNVDYAYYMKGLANFNQDRGVIMRYIETDLSVRDLGTSIQSFNDFADLIRRFPNSPYAADAQQRMVYLRNLMADKELDVAEFYYQRKTYLAAANRANYIVDHYQQAPAIVPALGIMVKSYRKLNLEKLANETLTVLALNYPDSEVYKELVK